MGISTVSYIEPCIWDGEVKSISDAYFVGRIRRRDGESNKEADIKIEKKMLPEGQRSDLKEGAYFELELTYEDKEGSRRQVLSVGLKCRNEEKGERIESPGFDRILEEDEDSVKAEAGD